MATQAEMEGLASKLVTSGPLSWVVSDCPVVALFKNNATQELDSLGQHLNRNACGDILRLWIGVNHDTRELFVTLTIRIRMSPVRKKTRRQGRLMFLVVPAESLCLHTTCVDYSSIDELPPCLLDMPNDVESAKCQLLHTSIGLGSSNSDVIMPEYQCRPNVMPQAMKLLRKLKDLSEVSSFRLYTNHHEVTHAALQDVSSLLAKSGSITTPTIATKGLYPGARSACKNLWVDQGWLEEVDPIDQTHVIGTTQKKVTKPLDTQPPPYEPDTVPPLMLASSAQDGVPSLPPTTVVSSAEGATNLARASPPSLPSALRDNLLANSQANQIFASSPGPSTSTSEPSLSSNYTATFLSGFPSISPSHRLKNVLDAQKRSTLREGSCLSVQVAASICDRAFPDNNVSTRANTPGEDDQVPDSLTRKRLPSGSSGENARNAAKRLATAEPNSRPLLLNRMNTSVSPTIANTSLYHGSPATRGLANNGISVGESSQLSRWLTRAWNHCPTAHYLFATELLRYGAAISSNQSEEIADCHIHCTLALIAYCRTNTTVEKHCGAGDETKSLLRWLYTLRPGAEMEAFSSLLQLSMVEQRMVCESTEEENTTFMNTYKEWKADIISQAYTQFGREVLQRGEHAIVTSMLREEERCKI